MPRVHHVKKARKDNPAVKRGESYYWWKFRYGGKRFSKTPPRSSQLTQSAYYSTVRSLCEQIEDAGTPDDGDDLIALRDEIVSEIENLRDETQSSLDNMPDSLQYSPTGELLQERVDALENAQSELESVEEFDEDEPDSSDFDEEEDCETCEGRGHVDPEDTADHCTDCNGDGVIMDNSEYESELDDWKQRNGDHIENAIEEMTNAVSECEV